METSQEVRAWEKIIKNSLDIIGTMCRKGYFININEACESILGYGPEEIKGKHFSNFVCHEDLESTVEIIQNIIHGTKVKNFRSQCVHKNGAEIPLHWSAAWSEEDEVILVVGRDVSELEKAKKKEELHQALIQHGTDMHALFDQDLNYSIC